MSNQGIPQSESLHHEIHRMHDALAEAPKSVNLLSLERWGKLIQNHLTGYKAKEIKVINELKNIPFGISEDRGASITRQLSDPRGIDLAEDQKDPITNFDNPIQTPTSNHHLEEPLVKDNFIMTTLMNNRKANNLDTTEKKSRLRTRQRTVHKRLTDRQISFCDVFRDGNPQYEILEWPKRSGDMFIISCEEHNLEFGRETRCKNGNKKRVQSFASARWHLFHWHDADETDPDWRWSNDAVISVMGFHVFDCSRENKAMNNKAFHRAVMDRKFLPTLKSREKKSKPLLQQDLEKSNGHNDQFFKNDSSVCGRAALEPPPILGVIYVQTSPFQGEEGQQPGGISQTAVPAFQNWLPTENMPLSSYETQDFGNYLNVDSPF
ncbi:hypothetical protein GGI35DRAFT_444910 [Trichoderma velutinum]